VQTDDESYEVEQNECGGKSDDRPRAAPDNPETVNLADASKRSGHRSQRSTYEQHLRTQRGEPIHSFTKKVGRGACVGEEQDLPERVRVEDEEPMVGEVDGTRTVLVYKVSKEPLSLERQGLTIVSVMKMNHEQTSMMGLTVRASGPCLRARSTQTVPANRTA
jgi:hypothetical protein